MPQKRALIIALNDYPAVEHDLPCCENDAKAMERLFRDEFDFQVESLTNKDATCDNVEAALKKLLAKAERDDSLVLYFSGHGHQIVKNKTKEECLALYDGFFHDDRLQALAQNLPPGVLTVIIDACFSGGLEKRHQNVVDNELVRVKCWTPDRNEAVQNIHRDRENQIVAYRPFACNAARINWTPSALRNLHRKNYAAMKNWGYQPREEENAQLQLNGLLILACAEDETASASAPGTDGLSAFTFAFRKAIAKLGKETAPRDLALEAGRRLEEMGFRQTPVVKEPQQPQGLACQSFVTRKYVEPRFQAAPRAAAELAEWRAPLANAFWPQPRVVDPEHEGLAPIAIEIVRAEARERGLEASKEWLEVVHNVIPTILNAAKSIRQSRQPQQFAGLSELIPVIASAIAAAEQRKLPNGYQWNQPAHAYQRNQPAYEQGFERWIPLLPEIVRAVLQQKEYAAPFGGIPAQQSRETRGPEYFEKEMPQNLREMIPVIVELVRAFQQGLPQQQRTWGAEAWAPRIAQILAAAQRNQPVAEKTPEAWVPQMVEAVRAYLKQNEFQSPPAAGRQPPEQYAYDGAPFAK